MGVLNFSGNQGQMHPVDWQDDCPLLPDLPEEAL
jgi:hypothetical protein